MDMQSAIRCVVERQDLTEAQMLDVMRLIMTGQATPAQIGGFLVGLRMKGETLDEITAAARVMRELATPVPVAGDHLVDTCGTGRRPSIFPPPAPLLLQQRARRSPSTATARYRPAAAARMCWKRPA